MNSQDKKILLELIKNSRQPYSIISKKTRLTREIVTYRIQKLQEQGIIKNYLTRINQSKFSTGTALIHCKLNKQKETNTEKIIKENKNINWAAELLGTKDLAVTFQYKDTEHLSEILSEITKELHIKEHDLSIYIKEYKFDREGIFTKKETKQRTQTFKKIEELRLDDKDKIILKEMTTNSRISNANLAKLTKLSEDAVRQRIKKLEHQQIITGYTISIDFSELQMETYHFGLQIDFLSKEIANKIKYYVNTKPEIIFCAQTTGKFNIIMTITTNNREELKQTIEDIRKTFDKEILDYELQIILKDIKEKFMEEKLLE